VDIYKDIELQDCPICAGTPLLEEERGWCMYIMCMDCGCHTVEAEFRTPEGKEEAALQVARLWNLGKVISENPGD